MSRYGSVGESDVQNQCELVYAATKRNKHRAACSQSCSLVSLVLSRCQRVATANPQKLRLSTSPMTRPRRPLSRSTIKKLALQKGVMLPMPQDLQDSRSTLK